MASIKQKLASAIEFDKSVKLDQESRIHQVAKMMNIKRKIPTYSVNGVFSCQLSPVSEHLAMGYGNGDVEVFNVETGEQVKLVQNVCKNLPVTSIRFLHDSPMFYATGPSGKVLHLDPVSGTKQRVIEQDSNEISCLDVNSDNTYLSIVGKKPDVYIYDTATNTVSTIFKGSDSCLVDSNEDGYSVGHSQRLFVTKFDPVDKFTVLSAGWDCSVKLWDIRSNAITCNIVGPKVCGEGVDITGNYLLTASWYPKDSLQLWDIRTAKLVTNLTCKTEEETEFLYCAQFYSADKIMCGGSGISNPKLIDVKENEVIDEIDISLKVIQCMSISRTNKTCVVAGIGEHATCINIGEYAATAINTA